MYVNEDTDTIDIESFLNNPQMISMRKRLSQFTELIVEKENFEFKGEQMLKITCTTKDSYEDKYYTKEFSATPKDARYAWLYPIEYLVERLY